MPSKTLTRLLPYGVVILSVVIALVLMLMLHPWVSMSQTPFLLFFGSVTFSAWYGGFKPGILATLITALISNYFFFAPVYALNVDSSSLWRMGLYSLECLLISLLCEKLRVAKQRAEINFQQMKVSEERFRLALNSSDIIVFQQDQDLRYEWIHNSPGSHLAESMLGKTDFEIFGETTASELTALKQKVLDQGVAIRDEVCLTLQDRLYYFDLIAEPLRDRQGKVRGVSSAAFNITQRKQAEQRLQDARQQAEAMRQRLSFLDTASTVLATSLDYETTLQSVIDLVVPEFADLCTIDIFQADRTEHPLVAVKAKEPAQADLVRQMAAVYPLDLSDRNHPMAQVVHGGEPLLISEIAADPDANFRFLQALDLKSAICVPLMAHDEVFGILTLAIHQSSHRYTSSDLTLVEALGRRVGLAIENSRLHQRLKSAIENRDATLAIINAWLANAPVGLAFLDPEFRFIHVNQAQATINGLPLEQHLNRTISEVLPEWAPQLTTIFRQVMETQEPLLNQEIHGATHPSEVQRSVLASYYPVCLPNGQLLGVGVAVIDISDRIRAENELKQSEEEIRRLNQRLEEQIAELQTVLDVVPVGISIATDPELKIIRANPFFQQIFGSKPNSNLSMKSTGNTIAPRKYFRDGCELKSDELPMQIAIAQKQELRNVELQIVRADGTRFDILGSATPLLDEQGEVRGCVAAFMDITQHKHTEIALKNSQERLRLAVEGADLGMWDHDLQTGGMLWSERCKSMFGLDTNAKVSYPLFIQQVHPDDREGVHQAMQQAIAHQQEYDVEIRTLGVAQRQRWLRLIGRAYYNSQGQPTRMAGVALDVTKRRRTEEALRESEQSLKLALKTARLISWELDLATQTWRRSDQLEAERNAYLLENVHPDDRELIRQAIFHAVHHQTEYEVEYRVIEADQQIRWVKAHGRVLFAADGSPWRITGVTLDITDRKQTEVEQERLLQREQAAREAAETANRIKDEFLAVLSHELRSPLNPILGWASLLRSRPFDEASRNRALETIERNAKLQAQLIEDLLDVSRILRGKLRLNVAPVNLISTIQAAIETVRLSADAKSIQITTHLEPGAETVLGDGSRLQQVVWNLLSNAVKFTPNGGQVEVHLSLIEHRERGLLNPTFPPANYAQITVRDNGKGIKPDFLPYVFDYFRQADSTTTRSFGGLGLGLAIVRHLVELHGGTVNVTSPGEDQGATFFVKLPLIITHRMTVQENGSTSASPSYSAFLLKGVRVLVVDDEPDMREYIAVVLKQSGAEVAIATSAQEALTLMTQTQPDLLLSDIGMPIMNGYSLLQQIRELPTEQGGQVPAIALTAYASEQDQQQAITAGFQLHLAKPVQPNRLIEAIVELLQIQQPL